MGNESVDYRWGYELNNYKYTEQMVAYATNDKVGCTPVALGPQKVKAANGLLTMSNQNTLAEATVLVPSSPDAKFRLAKGDVVYFHASLVTAQWAKQQFEVDGEKVIFVPLVEVLMVKRKETVAEAVPFEISIAATNTPTNTPVASWSGALPEGE